MVWRWPGGLGGEGSIGPYKGRWRIHFHDLRHTAALLMMRGGHIPAVSRRLGHANTSITTELYGHAHDSDDDRISDRLDAMLSPPATPLEADAEGA